jgi:hypothetical protein
MPDTGLQEPEEAGGRGNAAVGAPHFMDPSVVKKRVRKLWPIKIRLPRWTLVGYPHVKRCRETCQD